MIVRYAGAGYNYGSGAATAGISLDSTSPALDHLTVELSSDYGLQLLNASSPSLRRSTVRAEIWDKLGLNSTRTNDLADAPRFTVIVIHDPHFTQPCVLATNLTLTAQAVGALYRDRRPVEQGPLAAKQMIGAVRAFVFVKETCQRLPELALVNLVKLTRPSALPARPSRQSAAWKPVSRN